MEQRRVGLYDGLYVGTLLYSVVYYNDAVLGEVGYIKASYTREYMRPWLQMGYTWGNSYGV